MNQNLEERDYCSIDIIQYTAETIVVKIFLEIFRFRRFCISMPEKKISYDMTNVVICVFR